MATQGIVSILNCDGQMFFKVVAGSNGSNAAKLVEWAKAHQGAILIEDVYKAAQRLQFGSPTDLVVQESDGSFAYDGDEIDAIEGLYLDRAKFLDPRFNPRWEAGTAEYVEVVTLSQP